MISEPIKKAIRLGLEAAIPESSLTVSQWASKYRVVSMERVADPSLAGFWQNERTPYLVEVMDAVNDPSINEIVFKKSAQVGGTEVGNNIIGYFIHIDPATILYVAENEGKANAWSVESFAPMLRDTPALADIMGVARQRDSTNRIESKAFRGGHFALAWSTSPATLSSRPRRVVITDETDAFEPTKEGDPIGLAEARTKTAGAQRKIIHISTPRDEETSTVEPLYLNSTRERYFVPCPHCEEFQFLTWRDEETGLRNVRWEDDQPETAAYYCKACAEPFAEDDKEWMLANGEWLSTNSEYSGNRRGFWINELYSPFSTWADMAKAYIESKNHPEKLKVFVNTRLAETWKNDGEKIDYADLKFKEEDYEAEVPDGVLLLTAGVDVQDDRIECEVIGWGLDFESWSIAYKVFYGSPAGKEVWDDLKAFLTRDFDGTSGDTFKVKAACIDTGGHYTQEAYKFCKQNAGRKFWAIKGANTPGKPINSKPTKNNALRVNLYTIGTESAKDTIFANLKKEEHGPGYCHFPTDREKDAPDYFKMLCAEKKITKFVSGKKKEFWVKVSANARNEALDCRVYGLAAVHILNPDWKSFQNARKNRRERIDPRKNTVSENDINPVVKPPAAKKSFISKSRRRGGFVKNW
jgi:phage terminase large subunit GpA-like protein